MSKSGKKMLPNNYQIHDFLEIHGENLKKAIHHTQKHHLKTTPITYPLKDALPEKFLIKSKPETFAKHYAIDFGKYACDVSEFVNLMGPLIAFLRNLGIKTEPLTVAISKTEDPFLVLSESD
ncbi:MAG: hypothetical protein CMF61_07510 [Magnetococcales bacterium]|nr:hypothetical protein [Magnetococcales bacterium]|tara:strand:- start:1115 stop:1480 length:366 start_codon:yes stop_codon:yes gene_type:complete